MTGSVTTRADVIIVGGGPAGCAAAIVCASAGFHSILIESAAVSENRKPGETLHPGVETLLKRLGAAEAIIEAGFPRHVGHWVEWDGPRRFEPFGSDDGGAWEGFQARRDLFDEILLNRAQNVGVEIWRPCKAMRPLVEFGRVVGVVTQTGTVEARAVIDASGRRRWLARHLKLPVARYSPRLVAAYGHAIGSLPERDVAPLLRAGERGWTWTAGIGSSQYAWVRLILGLGETWGTVPAEFSNLVPISGPRGADVTWSMVVAPAGPGYFLTGDSSAVLDPAASHGILKALMSGLYASELLVGILNGHLGSGPASRAYREVTTRWFQHDVQKLNSTYRVFPRWPGLGDEAQMNRAGFVAWREPYSDSRVASPGRVVSKPPLYRHEAPS
jgi:flavin-dependent dehydrogenase